MFWLFDRKSDCDYVFVYDDVDKSVEYVNYVSLVQAGVEIAGTIKFADMLSTARYRMVGFSDIGVELKLNYCNYRVGQLYIQMCLYIMKNDNSCQAELYFRHKNERCYYLTCAQDAERYFCKSDINMFSAARKTTVISIDIPSKMLEYFLSLRSQNNFDRVMKAFDNLFGSDISKLASNIRFKNVQFIDWFE